MSHRGNEKGHTPPDIWKNTRNVKDEYPSSLTVTATTCSCCRESWAIFSTKKYWSFEGHSHHKNHRVNTNSNCYLQFELPSVLATHKVWTSATNISFFTFTLTPILSGGWWGNKGSAAWAPPGMRSGVWGWGQGNRPTPTKSPLGSPIWEQPHCSSCSNFLPEIR